MPLLLSKQISPHAAYAVWNIQETNQQLKDIWQHEIPTGMNSKRLAEWMVGKILIKKLCTHFDLAYSGISPDEFGKPHLIGIDAEISISHSFPMAAAMIHLQSPCGIDLERTRTQLERISHKFISESESMYANDLEKLCAIWCGKEVLYKIYGRKQLSLKDETTIHFETDEVMSGLIHKKNEVNQAYKIHFEKVKDYFLAYSI